MRNGNHHRKGVSEWSLLSSYRTYEEWKRRKLNIFVSSWGTVLTVPMRNGNVEYFDNVVTNWGSYRTYEEWKPKFGEVGTLIQNSSYRTYEEWKHG